MPEEKYTPFNEWLNQAQYDLETAETLFRSGRMVYVLFFCHLTIEKGLKALWIKKFNSFPPKTHSLIYLIDKMELKPGSESQSFLSDLNALSVPTRYPESLAALSKDLNQEKVTTILLQTKLTLKWINTL